MGISCRVSYKNNAVEVVDKNGQPSKLYYDALALTKNEDDALDIWFKAFSQEFTDQVRPNRDNVTLDEVLKFVSANSSFNKKLDPDQIRSIKDIMDKNSFETLSELYKTLVDIFKPEGVIELNTEKAYKSGLFDLENLSEINLDEIDDILDSIEGTLRVTDIYVAPSSDNSASFVDTSRKTILGTPEFISQEEIEQEIIDNVENTKDVKEVSSYINSLPYSSFIERFNNNESFKTLTLNNVAKYTKVNTLFIVDGKPTTKNLSYYKSLINTVSNRNNTENLSMDFDFLADKSEAVWSENQEDIKQVLREIEQDQFQENGIDIFGLSNFSSNKELVMNVLNSLGSMLSNTTNESVFNFAEDFTKLVPQKNSTTSELLPESLEPFSQNIFRLDSTLSESELFRDFGLVKVSDNLYHKVDLGSRSNLYEELYQQAKETGYPISVNPNNKEESLRDLEKYVLLQDSTVDKDIREEYILNKIIFKHPKTQDTNDYSQLSDITTDTEYLVRDFARDFNDYIVIEKQKDSQVYRDTLSKFRVVDSGLSLVAPIKSIEGLEFEKELTDYIRLKKDQSMKYLLPARATNLKKVFDLEAVNNPASVPVYSKQYAFDNGLLVTEKVSDPYVNFFGNTYAKIAEDSTNSVFKPVPKNLDNNYYVTNLDFVTEEDIYNADQVLNDAKFSFTNPVVTEQDFNKSVEDAGIKNEIKFSMGTYYANEYVALNPDVQVRKGKDYQFDLEWDVLYKGLPVGKMYYSREDKTWVDGNNYSRKDFSWMLSENKNDAANVMAERYKPEEKVDLVDVTINELMKTAKVERSPLGKDLIYNDNLVFNIFQLDNNLDLQSIFAMEPNKGTATAFMRHLSEIADRNNMTITLTAKPFSDRETKMTFNQLVGFYRRFGFKPDPEYVFDTEEEGLNMIREPRLEQEEDKFDGYANYERWRGTNKEYSRSNIQDIKTGEPVVVRAYHGTTNEFYEFDASLKGNIEGHLGKVNYFTSDYQDASSNYLSDGADLKLRVAELSERTEDKINEDYLNEDGGVDLDLVKSEYKLTDEDIDEIYSGEIPEVIDAKDIAEFIAKRDLVGSEEIILDVYVKLNNPVVLGNKSTWVDAIPESEYSDYLDDAAQEIAEENDIDVTEAMEENYAEVVDRAIYNSGAENVILRSLMEALQENGYDYDIASEILSDAGFDYGSEIDLNQLEKSIRNYYFDQNYEGEMASSQVIADMFKSLGYDGIILTDVSTRFPNMNLNSKTSHIHVFDEYSNQIKLADGSNTHFGSTPDIRYSITGLNGAKNVSVLPVIDKLKQTGLANSVRLMTSKEIDAQLGRLGVNLSTRKQVAAYHASSNMFDRFNSAYVGQAFGSRFGWGHYFTNSKDVAEYFKDNRKVVLNIGEREIKGMPASMYAIGVLDNKDSIKEFIKNIKDFTPIALKNGFFSEEDVENVNYLVNELNKGTDIKVSGRNLYKVSFDDSSFLTWDRPVNKDIVKRIQEKTNINLPKIKSGEDLYTALEYSVGHKKASKILIDNDILGMKYPLERESSDLIKNVGRELKGEYGYVVYDDNAITIEERTSFQKQLSEKGIKPIVNGFVYNNEVFLNRDTITEETPIHEFNHLFTDWMKANRPSLYKQGIELVKEELSKEDSDIASVINYVNQTQPNLQGEKLYEEILTELTGREGAALIESGKKSGIIEWLKNFFKEIGNMLGILDATPEQIANMTVREFAKSSAVQLLKGEDILSKVMNLSDSISSASMFGSVYSPINNTVESVAEELRACN